MSPFPLTKTASQWCKENIGENKMDRRDVLKTTGYINALNDVFDILNNRMQQSHAIQHISEYEYLFKEFRKLAEDKTKGISA
jgi:hypothetical protein